MSFLEIIQIVLALLLTIGILLQNSGSGIEGALGGGSSYETVRSQRRGFDKFSFNATILFAIAFVVVSLLIVIL